MFLEIIYYLRIIIYTQAMGIIELLLIAVGLSMDAFAVSICKGLPLRKIEMRHTASVGLWFGGFQALMPLVGYYAGVSFADVVESVDHWIAFVLLAIIGFNMIREAVTAGDACGCPDFSMGNMLLLAVATSIDALAVGVTFAFLGVDILRAVLIIGLTTFVFSVVGIHIGNAFGCRYKSKAEFAGGVILVAIGLKILIEHLFE